MSCPKCKADTRVIDSRPHLGRYVKRRRLCLACGHRFTTWEQPETPTA